MSKFRWLLPKVAVLDTKEECQELLELGFTLINNERYVVRKRGGRQLKSNPKRSRDYHFSHPYLWQVWDCRKEEIVDINTLSFKIRKWVLKKFPSLRRK